MRMRCSGTVRSRVMSGGESAGACSPRAARSALPQNIARIWSVAGTRPAQHEPSGSRAVAGMP